jgi:hypothetical protein
LDWLLVNEEMNGIVRMSIGEETTRGLAEEEEVAVHQAKADRENYQ